MKRALVTGGSGDIGGAICRRLAADGLHVVVHANTHRARADAVRHVTETPPADPPPGLSLWLAPAITRS